MKVLFRAVCFLPLFFSSTSRIQDLACARKQAAPLSLLKLLIPIKLCCRLSLPVKWPCKQLPQPWAEHQKRWYKCDIEHAIVPEAYSAHTSAWRSSYSTSTIIQRHSIISLRDSAHSRLNHRCINFPLALTEWRHLRAESSRFSRSASVKTSKQPLPTRFWISVSMVAWLHVLGLQTDGS